MNTLNVVPTTETELARHTLDYFIREWADDDMELSICKYLQFLVEEQEDRSTRLEKLISGSTWISVGACYAVSSGTYCTAVASILPEGTEVDFLFKNDRIVSFRFGTDASLSYSMPVQQFLNMFKPIEKKKPGKVVAPLKKARKR